MADTSHIEQEARRLVEEVRDAHIAMITDMVYGDNRSPDGQDLRRVLVEAALTEPQLSAVRQVAIQSCDMVLAGILAFLEYEISSGRIKLAIIDEKDPQSASEVDGLDMLAANYFGEQGWVGRFSKYN